MYWGSSSPSIYVAGRERRLREDNVSEDDGSPRG